MKALIYCRVMPHNKGVAKSDRLENQEKRCRAFLRQLNLKHIRTYRDEGEMHPIGFLPGIRSLLFHLSQIDEDVLVVSDHPARLGLNSQTRGRVIHQIQDFGGQYIATQTNPAAYIESLSAEIINQIRKET